MNRRELAAAYLLDTLEPAERTEVERRLADDAELRAEVEAARALTMHLGSLPGPAWPEAGVPTAAASPTSTGAGEIAASDPAADPRSGSEPGSPRRWRVRPVLALASLLVVAALGFGLGALLTGGDSSRPAPAIVLRPLVPTNGEEATVAMPAPGEMLFTAEGLPALESGQFYEIWLMSSESRLVPVASFRVGADGHAQVRVPLPADPASYRYFDVSRQRVDEGTAHSADSVLRGSTL
jgi:anti-sigma-K factor RskA